MGAAATFGKQGGTLPNGWAQMGLEGGLGQSQGAQGLEGVVDFQNAPKLAALRTGISAVSFLAIAFLR